MLSSTAWKQTICSGVWGKAGWLRANTVYSGKRLHGLFISTQCGPETCMLRLRQDTEDMLETAVLTSLTVMTARC